MCDGEQDQRAERGKRQVAARDRVDLSSRAVFAFACTQEQHARERGCGTAQMRKPGACEIEEAELHERVADPVASVRRHALLALQEEPAPGTDQ